MRCLRTFAIDRWMLLLWGVTTGSSSWFLCQLTPSEAELHKMRHIIHTKESHESVTHCQLCDVLRNRCQFSVYYV